MFYSHAFSWCWLTKYLPCVLVHEPELKKEQSESETLVTPSGEEEQPN